jgi:hypothetical protein
MGLASLSLAPLPILEMSWKTPRPYLKERIPEYMRSERLRMQSVALEIARLLDDRGADPLRSYEKGAVQIALALKHPDALCADDPPKTAIDELHAAAEITLAGLAQERARAVWVARKWLGCTPRSQHVRERLEVYAAIAARDPRAMLERARALLAEPVRGGDDWGRYLLSTALLGARAAGENAEGLRLWNTYWKAFYPGGDFPPYVIYLLALQGNRLSP